MCRSLAVAGYDVTLVVADGKHDEERDAVRIVDAGKSRGRLDRMLGATRRVLKHALAVNADLYHLHDPELLPVGLALKRRGKRVIFDAHEDLPRQILSKKYLHPRLRQPISAVAGAFERFACRRLDHVVAATPTIRDKFLHLGIAATDINNFPMLGELDADGIGRSETVAEVCYVGSIATVRGIREIVQAVALTETNVKLTLGGVFSEADLREQVQGLPGWARVKELGFLDRGQISAVLGRSAAGLVILHPTPAYLDSLPVKMFEYMSAGLPVIASNFPLWRDIVEGNDCGLCVDPLIPQEIARAIDQLVRDPGMAFRMGENGQRAVRARYNWGIEEKKLLALYESVL